MTVSTEIYTLTETLAAERYKANQRRLWNASADELRRWWPQFDGIMAPVTRSILAHARLPRDARVLDVATGFGEPALTVARAVGRRGQVIATDLSPAMLAVAAERARAAGIANVVFSEMDAEEPTLAETSFDAVVSRLGLMFLPNLDAALARLAALLVPGGSLVAAVWGPAEKNRWLSEASQALVEFLERVPCPPEAPGIFGLGAAGVAEGALVRAGLTKVCSSRVTLRLSWPSAEAYTAFHASSPMRRLVADEDLARQADAWREVSAMAIRRWGAGPLRLTGEVVVVSGRRRW